jgi:hypothetical protein
MLKPEPPAVAVVLLTAALAAVAAFGLHRLPGEMRDFEVYWTAASRALDSEPLYRVADGHYQFKYLPAFAVFAAPMALLPLPAAKALWFSVSAALLPLLVWLAIALLPMRRRPGWTLVLVVLIAMGKFYGHELVLGQVNLLFAVIVCVGMLLMADGRAGSAAALLVAAVVVKPYAVVFLPWIGIRRGRTAIITAAIAFVAVLAVPAVLYGIQGTVDLHRDWWSTVSGSTVPNLTNSDNVSLAGMFAKWLGPGPSAPMATLAASLFLLAVAAVVILRGRAIVRGETLEGALLLTLIPLLSPQGWDYVFLVATPAVVLFANYDDRVPPLLRWTTWVAVAVIGLSLFDVMGRERYATFMSWSIITWCFLVLIASLGVLRERRIV